MYWAAALRNMARDVTGTPLVALCVYEMYCLKVYTFWLLNSINCDFACLQFRIEVLHFAAFVHVMHLPEWGTCIAAKSNKSPIHKRLFGIFGEFLVKWNGKNFNIQDCTVQRLHPENKKKSCKHSWFETRKMGLSLCHNYILQLIPPPDQCTQYNIQTCIARELRFWSKQWAAKPRKMQQVTTNSVSQTPDVWKNQETFVRAWQNMTWDTMRSPRLHQDRSPAINSLQQTKSPGQCPSFDD